MMAGADRLGTKLSSTWHYAHFGQLRLGPSGQATLFLFRALSVSIIFHFSHILSQSDSKLTIILD